MHQPEMRDHGDEADRARNGEGGAAPEQCAGRAEHDRRGGGDEGGVSRPFRGRARQRKHRHQHMAEAERQHAHEAEAAEKHMRERGSGMIAEKAQFEIDRQREPERDQRDQRGERRPAIGRDHRHAAGAAQIVGQEAGEHEQADRCRRPAHDRDQRMVRIHAGDQHDQARHGEPEHELDRPHAGERAARRHRQELHRRADRRRRQHAEGQQMHRRERGSHAAAETDRLLACEQQDAPQRNVQRRRGGEKTEGQ